MVSITFTFPPGLSRNATVRRALVNAAYFVRDLWLARSPYASGDYARGLTHSGSIKVSNDRIEIINLSRHAQWVESGTRSFNIGLAMLRNGRGVRTAADGSRYKIVRIEPGARGATRAAGVSRAVVASFTKLFPMGMRVPRVDRYGGIKPYKPRRALQRPLKGLSSKPGSPKGFFIISEKAIRANPHKWQIPAQQGRKLGAKVQAEARPYVIEAIRQAVQGERDRQMRVRGKKPGWYRPAMSRNPLKTIPPERLRK